MAVTADPRARIRHPGRKRAPAWLEAASASLALALMLAAPAMAEPDLGSKPAGAPDAGSNADAVASEAAMSRFLDRLMQAESGGRDDARNPRSTALGPFQFIESTFLEVTRRHFPAETEKLTPTQVLQLRTSRAFARRAAEAFTRDNAAILAAAGLTATFANLRLAFLVGPQGAVRLLKAEPKASVIAVLGANVVQANPFMAGMTAADLAAWSDRNLSAGDLASARVKVDPSRLAAVVGEGERPAKPAIAVKCNRRLASCRRWIALASSRLTGRIATGPRQRSVRR